MSVDHRPHHLIQYEVGDRRLDGLLYPADPEQPILLHVHGKGGNFYSGPGRALPMLDHERRFGHLAINMACHDLAYTRYDLPMPMPADFAVDGGMWEHIARGHEDVRAAVEWLRARSYRHVVIVGHSSGGFYAAQTAATHQGLVEGIVMISPVLSHRAHFVPGWFPDAGAVQAELDAARERLAEGQGGRLVHLPGWYHAISTASLVERAEEPEEPLRQLLAEVRVPAQMIVGAREHLVEQWRAAFDVASEPRSFTVIEGADHAFLGAEPELLAAVQAFVTGSDRSDDER